MCLGCFLSHWGWDASRDWTYGIHLPVIQDLTAMLFVTKNLGGVVP